MADEVTLPENEKPGMPEFVDSHDAAIIAAIVGLVWAEVDVTNCVNSRGQKGVKSAEKTEEACVKRLVRAMGYSNREQAAAVVEYILSKIQA